MKRVFRRGVLAAAVLGAVALSGTALAIDEVEPNQGPLSTALTVTQVLSAPGDLSIVTEGATVSGVIGVLSGTARPDVDVFTFFAEKDRMVTIHIEGPTGGQVNFDGILTLFSPQEDGRRNRAESFASTSSDPIIEKFKMDRTGSWSVALSPFAMTFTDGGALEAGSSFLRTNGAYKLVITPVAPAIVVKNIEIAVKPGSAGRAPINPKAQGNIPVALLSSDDFDALTVDVSSLTFGAKGDEASLRNCGKQGVDVNRDGKPDLLCHFDNQATGFKPGDAEGFLNGKMTDATGNSKPIIGRGVLKALPAKRGN